MKNKVPFAVSALGIIIFAASLAAKHLGVDPAACGFLSGLGCSWAGLGVVILILLRLKPGYAKKYEIDQNDERNIQIRDKASYITFFATLFSLLALVVIFIATENIFGGILTICAMVIQLASYIIARFYYDKKI